MKPRDSFGRTDDSLFEKTLTIINKRTWSINTYMWGDSWNPKLPKVVRKQFAPYQVGWSKTCLKKQTNNKKIFCCSYSELWLIGYVLIKTWKSSQQSWSRLNGLRKEKKKKVRLSFFKKKRKVFRIIAVFRVREQFPKG